MKLHVYKNRILKCVSIMLALFFMFPICVNAKENTEASENKALTPKAKPVLSVTDATTYPGGTTAVVIKLANNPGIWGMRFKIEYDRSLLELADIQSPGNCVFDFNEELTGPVDIGEKYIKEKGVEFVVASNKYDENKTEDGNIVKLVFKVNGNAGYSVTTVKAKVVQTINAEEVEIDVKEQPGKITIEVPSDYTESSKGIQPILGEEKKPFYFLFGEQQQEEKKRKKTSDEAEEEIIAQDISPVEPTYEDEDIVPEKNNEGKIEIIREERGTNRLKIILNIILVVLLIGGGAAGVYFGVIKKRKGEGIKL